MRLNPKYVMCDYLDEVHIIPEQWDKKDQSEIIRMEGSGGEILKLVCDNPGISLEELQKKVLDEFGHDDAECEYIFREVKNFIDKMTDSRIIL